MPPLIEKPLGNDVHGLRKSIHYPWAFAGIDPDLALLDEQQLLGAAAALGVEHLFCSPNARDHPHTTLGMV